MKANMKLKSTLWALAFAVAAVSCSDDLEEGGGIIPGNGQNVETAKINVAINTEVVTKATPGENGDDNEGEVGEESEYKVKDVAIFLYQKNQGEFGASDQLDIKGEYLLKAAGWTKDIGVMQEGDVTTGSTAFPNKMMTTVEVAVAPGTSLASAAGTTYGVIAITNLGETDGKALVAKLKATDNKWAKVSDLANYLQGNTTPIESETYHVMSTHALTGSAGDSRVTFKTGDTDIPETSVYVERLSAKIRLTPAANITNFSYTPTTTSMVDTKIGGDAATLAAGEDNVTLTDVMVVNQLTSKSYLLKRLATAETSGDLGTTDTNDVLIADEDGNSTTSPTKFVIDPWTRSKDADALETLPSTPAQLAYANRFVKATYGDLFSKTGNYTNYNAVSITKGTLDEAGHLNLCYTQENTMSRENSLKGFTTGAIFKATYTPAKWMSLETDGGVKATDREETDSKTFYTYTYGSDTYIFENYDAILGYIIAKANIKIGDNDAQISYNDFKAQDGGSLSSDFGTKINALRRLADSDPFGYIAAMVAEYDKTQAESAGTATYEAINEYLKDFTPDEGEATTTFNSRVKKYTDGVCYYPYWIKHAANSQNSGPGSIGVMEFAIVRNNIYDLSVAAISGLGYSEVDVTDPDGGDEDTELKIMVRLYVKNWVVRSNDNIIL